MNKDNKKWRSAGLYALLAIVVISLAVSFFDQQPQGRETWRYSQFLQEVQSGQIESVKISADRSKAFVPAQDGTPILVNLPPGDSELIDILSNNNVDIAVLPQSDDNWVFRALSTLIFPILLLVGLFFLLRRA